MTKVGDIVKEYKGSEDAYITRHWIIINENEVIIKCSMIIIIPRMKGSDDIIDKFIRGIKEAMLFTDIYLMAD
jgi:hypothetical protein